MKTNRRLHRLHRLKKICKICEIREICGFLFFCIVSGQGTHCEELP